jgi:hypothetical protein
MKKIVINGLIALPILGFIAPCYAQFRPDRPTFFEDGQLYLDQEVQRLQEQLNSSSENQGAVEHPSQLLTIDSGSLKWQKYISRDGGFSIWIPQGIQSEETIMVNTDKGDLEFKVLAIQPESWRFIAGYSQEKDLTPFGDEPAILELIKNRIIARTNFELIDEQPIKYQSYSGQSLTLKKDQEVIYFQVYVINQRIYVLGVNQKASGGEENITSFFNSFRLLQ